eukprot:PhF_6_TR38656/c0_g1_i1/m.57755
MVKIALRNVQGVLVTLAQVMVRALVVFKEQDCAHAQQILVECGLLLTAPIVFLDTMAIPARFCAHNLRETAFATDMANVMVVCSVPVSVPVSLLPLQDIGQPIIQQAHARNVKRVTTHSIVRFRVLVDPTNQSATVTVLVLTEHQGREHARVLKDTRSLTVPSNAQFQSIATRHVVSELAKTMAPVCVSLISTFFPLQNRAMYANKANLEIFVTASVRGHRTTLAVDEVTVNLEDQGLVSANVKPVTLAHLVNSHALEAPRRFAVVMVHVSVMERAAASPVRATDSGQARPVISATTCTSQEPARWHAPPPTDKPATVMVFVLKESARFVV